MKIKKSLRTIGLSIMLIIITVLATIAVALFMSAIVPSTLEDNNHNYTSYMNVSIPNLCNATHIEYKLYFYPSLIIQNIDSSTYPILLPYHLKVNTTELEVGERLHLTVTYYYSWSHNFYEELMKVDYIIIVDKLGVSVD